MQLLASFIEIMKTSHAIVQGLFGLASVMPLLPAAETLLQDGDFEGGRGSWEEIFGDGSTLYEYPESDGNPGRYGVMDNAGGFGIWVSNFNQPILLTELGLSTGQTYTFKQDMRILSGSSIGGFKVDFFSGTNFSGSTGDLFPALIGDGSTWETYSFDVGIPSGVDGIKVVPLWGANSRVGYDNIRVDTTPPVAPTEIPDADFSAGNGNDWEQSSGGGTFVFDFRTTDGNPGGHAVIDHSADDGGWGVLVTNNGTALPLSGLGLSAGSTYQFSVDMRLFGGARIGGLKVDFFNGAAAAGSTGDLFPALIGDGTTWETYDFQVNIPETATAIKVVGLWGAGSVVGFDNMTFDPTPIEVPPVVEIPNHAFDDGLTNWNRAGEPATLFSSEESGGNPGGYAVMDNNGTGFGVLVANGGNPIPLEGLGLEAGQTYRFRQDMRIFSGSEIGGLKVEFFNGAGEVANTGDLFPQIVGDGSSWATYEFDITIPPSVDGIKVVLLWGNGSRVGFDNILFDPTPIPSSPVLNADFEMGGAFWSEFQVGTTYRYPTTGGNPGGYAEMTNNGSVDSFGVIVSNSSSITPKERFGITTEGTFVFEMDMRIFSGSSIGGLKIEFFDSAGLDAGGSGDMFPVLIGDGSTWETYRFEVFIPGFVAGLKVTPLWGSGSVVGYDNIVTPGTLGSGFDSWIAGFPGVGSETGFNDDPDGDGQPKGLENYLGTDPSQFSAGLTVLDSGLSGGGLTFVHGVNLDAVPEASNATYYWSTDLVNFYADGESAPDGTRFIFNLNPGIITTGSTRAVRVESTSANPPGRVFVQLRVSGAPQ